MNFLFNPVTEPRLAELERRINALEDQNNELRKEISRLEQTKASKRGPKKQVRAKVAHNLPQDPVADCATPIR